MTEAIETQAPKVEKVLLDSRFGFAETKRNSGSPPSLKPSRPKTYSSRHIGLMWRAVFGRSTKSSSQSIAVLGVWFCLSRTPGTMALA